MVEVDVDGLGSEILWKESLEVDAPEEVDGVGSAEVPDVLRNTSIALPNALASTTAPESQTTLATPAGVFSLENLTLFFLVSVSSFLAARVWWRFLNHEVPASAVGALRVDASKLLERVLARLRRGSGLPMRSISVAEDVSALSMWCRSVSVQTTPPVPALARAAAAPARGGIGGGISEARRRDGIGGSGPPVNSECLRPLFV